MQKDKPHEGSAPWNRVRSVIPAYVATASGGAVAMFVNAPLRSPDDLIANALSVAVASVIAAITSGIIWGLLSGDIQQRSRRFKIAITGLLLVTVGIAWVAEYILELTNTMRYVIPLAGIVTIFASVFTPLLERRKNSAQLIWTAVILSIAMLAGGYWLTVNEFGFTEPPSLSLPPPPAS